jgi:hypothetical protein
MTTHRPNKDTDMEAFTYGKVSAAARRAYLDSHCDFPADHFEPIRGGYMMFAWESEIEMARAMGRGTRTGRGQEIHHFDRRAS